MVEVREKITVEPISAGLGADIRNVDLSKVIDRETAAAILDAWHDNLVLRFRGQNLDNASFVRFGAELGELDLPYRSRAGKPSNPDFPEMAVMSNIIENGKPIGGLGNAEAKWHTDLSYLDMPPKGSMLYALEIPEVGGNTWFANMYSAYEALPSRLKKKLEGMTCKHDNTYDSTGELRMGNKDHSDPRTSPGAVHPIVVTHPETKRKCLYLGRRLNAYIMGMELEESEELLDELFDISVRPEHLFCQRWKVGDLVIWDNRCTMHYRESFDQSTRRHLNRLQLKGEAAPVA